MSEFILHTPETAPAASKEALADVAKNWGFIPTMHATLAESPAALLGYEMLFGRIAESSLSPIEQQVAFQAINVLHGCAYCTMGHTYLSREAGMDEATISRLRAGQTPDDPKLAALFTFTRVVAEKRGEAQDSVADFLGAGFSKANVLDVVALIAAKTISNYGAALTNLPNEEFMTDPALAWSTDMAVAAA